MSKQNTYCRTNVKMEKNEKIKNGSITNLTYYCFDDIMKIEEFDFDNFSLDEIIRIYFNL